MISATLAVLSLEEFAARRRKSQTDIEDLIRDEVRLAVDLHFNTRGWDQLLDALKEVYAAVYQEESGESIEAQLPRGAITRLRATLRKTKRPHKDPDENTVNRITASLATIILNLAIIEAAKADEEELFLEWVHMDDDDVRTAHRAAGGQTRPIGEPYLVGGVQMAYPGDPSAPIELWINCRCTLRPVLASEENMARSTPTAFAISDKPWDGSPGRFTPEQYKRSCILHVCDGLEKSCHKLPIKEPEGALSRAGVHAAAQRFNQVQAPDEAKSKAKSQLRGAYRQLGEDPPDWLAAAEEVDVFAADEEPANSSTVVVSLPAASGAIHEMGEEPKHLTLAFLGEMEDAEAVRAHIEQVASKVPGPFTASVSGNGTLGPDQAKVLFVEAQEINDLRSEILQNDEVATALENSDAHPHFVPHVTVTYGDAPEQMAEFETVEFDRVAVWHKDEKFEYPLGGRSETDETASLVAAADLAGKVPWHGVLAPEGVSSGDGRKFAEESLSHRDLPLPLTWQKTSDDGHKGSVTVATIESITREDGLMKADGFFLDTVEADEVVGLISEFGKFGVSVDADSSEYELDEENETVVFTSARISSASIVAIPAFAEAYVALGPWNDEKEPEYDEDEAKKAQEEEDRNGGPEFAQFVDVAPGRTEDGPGWLTHPVDTDRLRDYWTRGPGAAKIGWGSPGDFDRCRANVAEYVAPQHLNGYCANRHYDALGTWPGRHAHAAKTATADAQKGEVLSMTAAGGHCAPSEWFKNPNMSGASALTVTDDGRVFGHLATWDACHIGFADTCTSPPHSKTAYAYFLTGEVALDDGGRCPVGNITLGGGHAPPRASARSAMAHYDSTSAVVADVTCGEDEFGIWVAGWVRPGTDDDTVTALRASALSGDWRKIGGSLELVAALAVNVPGFGIPRAKVAASAEGQLSLVAGGAVAPKQESQEPGLDVEAIAEAVTRRINEQASRRSKMAELAARVNKKEPSGAV